jgi:AcrR family transcriptional regulator
VGREAAPAEREAIDTGDSASPDRSLRADAVRNRERLLVAAAAAFAAGGADVPLEDIARSAGVGIGTLYRHFPTRDALVEAVYRHEVDVLCERADELLTTLPPDQALAEWLQLFVRHVATKRGMLSALKSMMGADTSLFEQSRARAAAAATKLLAAGAAAGTVRGDIQGADLLRAVGGICMSTDQERSEASERLVGLLFDGLRHGAVAASPTAVTASSVSNISG